MQLVTRRSPSSGHSPRDRSCEQGGPGNDAREVQPFGGRVVVATDRAEAVDGRRPGGRSSCWRREAPPVAASRSSNPSSAATSTAMLDEPARAVALLHRAVPAVGVHDRAVTSGTRVLGADPLDLGARPPRAVASSGERRSTCSSQRSGTTFVRVPPRTTPTFDGHARPPAVQSPAARRSCARPARTALRPFSGSTPGVRRPARRSSIVKSVMPLRARDDVAVRPRALEHERRVVLRGELADHRAGERRADLLVGVADVGDRARSRRSRRPGGRAAAKNPASRPALHVGHAGPARDVAVDAERPLGRRARRRTPCPCARPAGRSDLRSPRRRPITRSPRLRFVAVGAGRRSTSHPWSSNRCSHMSAIRFTPSGEYDPQSTLTMASSVSRNSG